MIRPLRVLLAWSARARSRRDSEIASTEQDLAFLRLAGSGGNRTYIRLNAQRAADEAEARGRCDG